MTGEKPSQVTVDEIFKKLIPSAQRHAAENGLSIGSVVAHPDYEDAFTLKAIEDNNAVLTLGGDEIRVPKDEIFDPNYLKNIATAEAALVL